MFNKLLLCFAGFLFSVYIGNLLLHIIVRNLRPQQPSRSYTVYYLGFLETLTYALSWILGFPGFIAIWLGIKTAGRWVPHKTPGAVTNAFLIGNLLSVVIGVCIGAMFKSILVNMNLIMLLKDFLPGLN